ncbi:MAG: S8 family serine peptidase [Leptospiraceae bacterium]|nr:S8 family serine peptidase [Leptospiraceae bacterium]
MKFILTSFLFITFLSNCQPSNENSTADLFKDLITLILVEKAVNPPKTCSDRDNIVNPTDALYTDQWHLNNTGSISGSVAGEDAKVLPVWSANNKGDDVVIAVVDDGLETSHEDLGQNISSVLGYNYITNTTDANHKFSNSGHGTAVAGVAAARDLNGVGVRGAAPCAKLVGRNILEQSTIPTTVESDAMTKDIDKIFISNNSWGAPDNTGIYAPSNSTWRDAIDTGIAKGRNAKGALYMWAAGNGSQPCFPTGCSSGAIPASTQIDNSNHDGQANYHGVLAIGGIGINGKKAAYSEEGANLWVVAHTQGNDTSAYTKAITTTDPIGDRGFNSSNPEICSDCTTNYSNRNYSNSFNGTSSATPLAAGVVALLLKAYPDLSWRDVREILAKSARKNDSTDTDWSTNTAGYNINHKYGFGAIDANNAITVAKTWTKITGTYASETSNTSGTLTILDGNTTGVTQTVTFPASTVKKVEYVEINFTTNHTRFGDLDIILTAPTGTRSVITTQHFCIGSNSIGYSLCSNYSSGTTLRFGSARHLGENPTGTWSLQVIDRNSSTLSGQTGTGSFSFNVTIKGRAN